MESRKAPKLSAPKPIEVSGKREPQKPALTTRVSKERNYFTLADIPFIMDVKPGWT